MALIRTLDTKGILLVTISRPDALNALNAETMEELHALMQETNTNDKIKGVVITGEGEKAFVAGADIKELSSLAKAEALKLSRKGQALFKAVENSPKPFIAAVNGFALGGGCELAMACHFRIATENARFGQPEVNLGIIPGYGGTQRLTRLIGRGKALELLLTGDMITAQEAKQLGLVNHVVSSREELVALAQKIMTKIAGKAPIAVANLIRSVNAGFQSEEAGYEEEAELFSECAATGDFKEGTSAFLEKRQPIFKGE